MATQVQHAFGASVASGQAERRSPWRPSWPLLVGIYVFLFSLYKGHVNQMLLLDGDTFTHVAAGRWILENLAVPSRDLFSHSMPGATWITQEWLSQVVLAWSQGVAGWNGVIAVTAFAFALTIALLTRALLGMLEPIRALLFALVAMLMVASHLLARPHILAMPLLVIWMIELFRARAEDRAPGLWLLPVMVLWANMHGSFTLGIAIAWVMAAEAVLAARKTERVRQVATAWASFLGFAMACALLTPHGPLGYWFTWQALAEDTYALERVTEWASPNFHRYQPLELWLLGGLALTLFQGLRLPVVRLVLLLGLLHLSLKHVRSVDYLGLIAPLIVAGPFAAQWASASANKHDRRAGRDDVVLRRLAQPAGAAAVLAGIVFLAAASLGMSRLRPVELQASTAPAQALAAVRAAGIEGPVFNFYSWGGFLVYSGVRDFIDGRSDMYRDAFIRQYTDAVELATPQALPDLLQKYRITWTLLPPGAPAVVQLDRMPGWRRLYSDTTAVVHVKSAPAAIPEPESRR